MPNTRGHGIFLELGTLRNCRLVSQCWMDEEHRRGLAPSVKHQAVGPRSSGAGSAHETHRRASSTQRRKQSANGKQAQQLQRRQLKLREAIRSDTAKLFVVASVTVTLRWAGLGLVPFLCRFFRQKRVRVRVRACRECEAVRVTVPQLQRCPAGVPLKTRGK